MFNLEDKDHRHTILCGMLIVIILVMVLCGISLYQSKYWLEISHYEIVSEKVTSPLCFLQLSDLHNSVFGEDNKQLIQAVTEQQPDFILLTGDMLNYYETDREMAVYLIEKLAEIAPVYFSYGNHEKDYEKLYDVDLAEVFENAGARVLDFEYEDLECKDQKIRLGGIYGYCLPVIDEEDIWLKETSFLKDYQETDRLTVLMCHMPVSWIEYGSLDSWQIDIIFSGHAHGGQVRLPVIGGLYAPDQGWFPGREEGLYSSDDGKRIMVLSRGLGSSTGIPRLNNRPELVVVHVIPQE